MKKEFLIETPRLLLRELTPADAAHFFELNNDPEVIRFTGDPPFQDVAAARQFLENYKEYQKHGYGRWAVLLKNSGAFLGWCGLKYIPSLDETDIGFRFYRKYWGKGYATEAAKACIVYGFETLALQKIVGRAMKLNTASLKVMEKAGLVFVEERAFEEHEGVYYVIERSGFLKILPFF